MYHQYLTIKDVRHVPQLTHSLMCVAQLDDNGYICFPILLYNKRKHHCCKRDQTRFPLRFICSSKGIFVGCHGPAMGSWHDCLGYMSRNGMEILYHYGLLPKFSFSKFASCDNCQHGKQTRNAHKIRVKSSIRPLDLVHTDLCGPMPKRSLGGALYFLTFIDDATTKVWVYLLIIR